MPILKWHFSKSWLSILVQKCTENTKLPSFASNFYGILHEGIFKHFSKSNKLKSFQSLSQSRLKTFPSSPSITSKGNIFNLLDEKNPSCWLRWREVRRNYLIQKQKHRQKIGWLKTKNNDPN